MAGAAKKSAAYRSRLRPRLKKNTEEKSRSSGSFFWIRALAMPLSAKTFRILITAMMTAMSPAGPGPSSRARRIPTTRFTAWAPKRSKKRHIKLLTTLLFLSIR